MIPHDLKWRAHHSHNEARVDTHGRVQGFVGRPEPVQRKAPCRVEGVVIISANRLPYCQLRNGKLIQEGHQDPKPCGGG